MTGAAEAEFVRETYRQPYGRSVVRQIEKTNKTTVDGEADLYTAFIWELARKFTNSTEEAEAAVEEMFSDVQRCAASGVHPRTIEDRLTARIALRRLQRFLE